MCSCSPKRQVNLVIEKYIEAEEEVAGTGVAEVISKRNGK